jgi:tetrahydromethanopterin S-methyltransferase subunit B
MLIAILIVAILILVSVWVGVSGINERINNLEATVDELLKESKEPNYKGVSKDGYPYTISKH